MLGGAFIVDVVEKKEEALEEKERKIQDLKS